MAALTEYDVNLKSSGYGDLQQVLGTTEKSPAKIILHANINKWSKRKPVRYPSYQRISEAQFAGNNDDHSDGYYYGVNCLAGAANWVGLHEVGFGYRRPQGGDNSPARLSDFIGYDHDAVPTMSASIPTKGYIDTSNGYYVTINITTNGSNTTGIDIAQIVQEATGRQLSTCYPFIMVGSYVCALKNRNAQNEQFDFDITPIYYGNAWQQGFVADLMSLANKFHVQPGVVKCTVFLASYSGAASSLPLDGEWTNIGDPGHAQMFDSPAFPMPNATGVDLSLAEYYESAKPAKVGVTATGRGITCTVTWPEGNPNQTTTVEITVRLGQGATAPAATKSPVYTPGSLMLLPTFSWSQLGTLYPGQGQTVYVQASVRTSINGTKWTQGEGVGKWVIVQ